MVLQGALRAAWHRRDSLGYQHCLVSLGIPRAQGTRPHFRCLPHHLDICPLSLAGSPSLVTSIRDRRDSTMHALDLGNQKNTVTEGNVAFPSLALYLGFLTCEMDWQ